MKRRNFLAGASAAIVAGVAGCSSNTEETPTSTSTPTSTPTETKMEKVCTGGCNQIKRMKVEKDYGLFASHWDITIIFKEVVSGVITIRSHYINGTDEDIRYVDETRVFNYTVTGIPQRITIRFEHES